MEGEHLVRQLSLVVLLSLTVSMVGDFAFGEAKFRVSPKIPPRSMVKATQSAASQARPEPAMLDTTQPSEAGFVPTSFQPQPESLAMPGGQPADDQYSPGSTSPMMPEVPMQPDAQQPQAPEATPPSWEEPAHNAPVKNQQKTSKKQPVKTARASKNKPVVSEPIPLVPDTPVPSDWVKKPDPRDQKSEKRSRKSKPTAKKSRPAAPPAAQTSQPEMRTLTPAQEPVQGKIEFRTEAPAASLETSTPAASMETSAPSAAGQVTPASDKQSASKTEPASKKASVKTSKPRNTQKTARKSSKKEKQVIQFPDQSMPQADANGKAKTAVAAKPAPKVFAYPWPKGYKPYVTPGDAKMRELHASAIHHFNQANYFGRKKNLEQAIAEYRRAILLNPAFADAYVGLSSAHIMKNDWESVYEETAKALKLKEGGFMDPANIVQAKFNLTMAHCAAAEKWDAKKSYREVKAAGHPLADQLWLFMQKSCKP